MSHILPSSFPGEDTVRPFLINDTSFRGRIVKLGKSLNEILGKHTYPEPVSRLLGEMTLLAAMLGENLKMEGMLTIQAKTDGIAHVLIADYVVEGKIRGYAGFNQERYDALLAHKSEKEIGFLDLIGKGYLAITIDPGGDMDRYQGIVEITGNSLSECIKSYFTQSEQIHTEIILAVGKSIHPGGKYSWHGGGMMIQKLPDTGGKVQFPAQFIEENWEKTSYFMHTVRVDELIDLTLSPEQLLYRLFHEDGVWVYDPHAIMHSCRCSRQKAENILKSIPKDELETLKVNDEIIVTCEFCNKDEVFSSRELDIL